MFNGILTGALISISIGGQLRANAVLRNAFG